MMKIVRFRKGQNGFTLLELLMAVSLLAIGLLAVVSMQSVAMNANMVSNRLTVATTLAQQVAEDVLSLNISDPKLNSPGVSMPLSPASPNYPLLNPKIVYIPGAGTYSACYSTQPNYPVIGSPVNGNTRIDIRVSYLSSSGWKDIVTHTAYKRVN